MSTSTYTLSFPGIMTRRGFWLYVCKIVVPEDKLPLNPDKTGNPLPKNNWLLYVGMTGDHPPKNKDKRPNRPNSPFGRITDSLGKNIQSNAIRRNLREAGLCPDQCSAFELIAHGPVFPETDDRKKYDAWWWEVAALERALTEALKAAGYSVLNRTEDNVRYDCVLWDKAKEAFGCPFPELTDP